MIERRAHLGLRQEDAAAKVPCSPNTWGRWESAHRLPHASAWLKIAKALGLKLSDIQRAAGNTLLDLSTGETRQVGSKAKPGAGTEPEVHQWVSMEAEVLDKVLANVDLHKLDQGGWHYTMELWRTQQREMARGLDLLMRTARSQVELFLKLHAQLLGNETGRVIPLPKPIKLNQPPQKWGGPPRKRGKGKKKR